MPNQSLPSRDIVSVFIYGRARHHAECSCGFTSRRKFSRAAAVHAALIHAAENRHQPNEPLVYDDRADISLWKRLTPAPVIAAMPLLLIPIGLWAAPPADATPLSFIQALNNNGIVVYDTTAALTTGLSICGALNHTNGADVARDLYMGTSYSDVPTPSVAAVWVTVAVEQLCPEHDHRGATAVA